MPQLWRGGVLIILSPLTQTTLEKLFLFPRGWANHLLTFCLIKEKYLLCSLIFCPASSPSLPPSLPPSSLQTVICPHKASTGETILQLPLRSTHLKIMRPRLKVAGREEVEARPQEDKSKTMKPVFNQHGSHTVVGRVLHTIHHDCRYDDVLLSLPP